MAAEQLNSCPQQPSVREYRLSYADAATTSLMVGLGETYLPAFGLTFGLGQVTAGLLASLPLLTGGVLQLLAPRIAHLIGSYKKWVLLCAATQVAVFTALAVAAAGDQVPALFLFIMAAIYWGANLSASPSWNNWIETLIPSAQLSNFLAVRSRVVQVAAFVAFVIGGLGLHFAQSWAAVGVGFQLIFATAAMSRLASMVFLAYHTEDHQPKTPSTVRTKVRQAMRSFARASDSRFLVYLLGTQVMVQISGPFLTSYMLGQRQFSYSTYAMLIAANYAARIVAYPWVARIARQCGNHLSLRIGGLLIAVSPLSWAFTTNVSFLFCSQLFAGFAWALYELATTLLIFEKIPAARRMPILSSYNFLNACAIVVGSLLGGWILSQVGGTQAYQLLFLLSGAGRLVTLVILTAIGVTLKKTKGRTAEIIPLPEPPPLSLSPEALPRTQVH